MKEYTEIVKKDTRIKIILVWILLAVLIGFLVLNILNRNLISIVLSASMIILILIVYKWISDEGKRKVENIKKMFRK